MSLALSVSPHGRLLIDVSQSEGDPQFDAAASDRIIRAFSTHPSKGVLHLATIELRTWLPPDLGFVRDFGREYLTRLCHMPGLDGASAVAPVTPPAAHELEAMALGAPPMKGLEYLGAQTLAAWWDQLDAWVREEIAAFPGGAETYLREKSPAWRMVGRVTFHLAENKRDTSHPFAFMATYVSKLSAQAVPRHLPLGNALKEYAGAHNRQALLSLLTPIQRAAEKSTLVKELTDSGEIYQASAWTPKQAYRFLRDVPLFEEGGIVVRVPDWWKSNRSPRATVSVQVGESKSKIGADAILDFSVGVAVGGENLSEAEIDELLASADGLVPLRGKWVEVDREKLAEALKHWKSVERDARDGGMTFFEGMRLLAGTNLAGDAGGTVSADIKEWSGIQPGKWLDETLRQLRSPDALDQKSVPELRAQLRPYQSRGANWLHFATKLGLGACLADDMGLGKTIQVLAALLKMKHDQRANGVEPTPNLLVVPASLIANWKSEAARFAPTLSLFVAHPSAVDQALWDRCEREHEAICGKCDLVVTTYGMLQRLNWLRERTWRLVVLDEAQAIKNSGTRQTRAVKELKAGGRIALTGTPVENRLSDLWSLFDFLNPGLLGGAKVFTAFAKQMAAREQNRFGPLRTLVQPYILRRLKTDKSVIADLPDKTEVNAYCGLTAQQAALYQQAVDELAKKLDEVDGVQRRGIVLAYLTRLKQICNHPSQWLGDNGYEPARSGKFARLTGLCEEFAARQEKALIFTQFREVAEPLAAHLQSIFGRPGLVLHGGVAVSKRRELVDAFQRDDGPPFFVLSLKAGGTGLNLTAASQVVHFDRWWNPAVENQATDRAFRIGQKRNVLVHKFVCEGTVEDKIDAMLVEKAGLARDLLDVDGPKIMTEMDNQELLRFVALDIHRAMEQ